MKKYYVQVNIPAGHEWMVSDHFDTYEEADAKVEELAPEIRELCNKYRKSYTMLIHTIRVCATCYTRMTEEDLQDNLIVSNDFETYLEVCNQCHEEYYAEQNEARAKAVQAVTDKWMNKAAPQDVKKRGA